MLQYLDKLQKEDMENLVKKREIQRALMKDVAKANEVSFLNTSLIPYGREYYCLIACSSSSLSNLGQV